MLGESKVEISLERVRLKAHGQRNPEKCSKPIDAEKRFELFCTRVYLLSHKMSLVSARCKFLQPGQIPVELIRIATVSVTIRILPDGLVRPAAGDGAGRAPIPGQHQRARSAELARIPGANRPPVIGAVNQWITPCLGVICGNEVRDPGDHGGG